MVQPDEPAGPAKKAAKKAPAKAPAKKAPAKKAAPQVQEQVTPAAPQPLPPDPAPKLAAHPVASTTSLPSSGSERSHLPLLVAAGLLLLLVLRKLRGR